MRASILPIYSLDFHLLHAQVRRWTTSEGRISTTVLLITTFLYTSTVALHCDLVKYKVI